MTWKLVVIFFFSHIQVWKEGKGVDYHALLSSYRTSGFQATNFGMAMEQITKMVRYISGLPCQFLGITHVPVCGYMLPNLSPIQSTECLQ